MSFRISPGQRRDRSPAEQDGQLIRCAATDLPGWPWSPHACPCLQPDQGWPHRHRLNLIEIELVRHPRTACPHPRSAETNAKIRRTRPLIFSLGELELN